MLKYAWLGVILMFLVGCEQAESIRTSLQMLTPHEQYAASLSDANLLNTALGQAWTTASEAALQSASEINPPFREVRYLDPAQPTAIAYQFALRRGQQLHIQVVEESQDSSRVFMDLFELTDNAEYGPRHRGSADSTLTMNYTVRRDRTYLVRVQPELLRGGRYTITIQTEGSLSFPVAGKDTGAIRSLFGAPRDGGRRRHHGVDIFAPRGTPVLAAADGVVTRVRNGGLGGKVVWQRDRYGHALYYAHLDKQLVSNGARVQAGDTLGLVGNTGNARTTPPHLHFGIYNNGPIDPYPYLDMPTRSPTRINVDTHRLGQWTRVTGSTARLRATPGSRARVLQDLPRHTTLYVEGGYGSWYRVLLPDQTVGYLSARILEPAQAPLREMQVAVGRPIQTTPTPSAVPIDTVSASASVAVLGQFESYLYVASPSGRTGWMMSE